MLHAVPERPRTDEAEYVHGALMSFSSVAAKSQRAADLMRMGPPGLDERAMMAELEARSLVRELLPLANLPTYAGALRVLHEVRRELGVNSRDVDLVALRRNLTLYLDGRPEGG